MPNTRGRSTMNIIVKMSLGAVLCLFCSPLFLNVSSAQVAQALSDFRAKTVAEAKITTPSDARKEKPGFSWHQQGQAAYQAKEYGKAIELFTKAVSLDPSMVQFVADLAGAYSGASKYDEGHKLLMDKRNIFK